MQPQQSNNLFIPSSKRNTMYYAMRRSIYVGLDSMFSQALDTCQKETKALYLIRERRNLVIDRLRNLRWKLSAKQTMTDDDWKTLKYCPIAGAVQRNATARPCHQDLICPFCWARRVTRDVFRRALIAWYGTDRPVKGARPANCTVNTAFQIDFFPWKSDLSHQQFDKLLATHCPNNPRSVLKQVATSKALGGHFLVTFEVLPSVILRRSRAVFMLPSGCEPKRRGDVIIETLQPSRASIAKAVSEACAYPGQYLQQVSVHGTHSVLRALRRSGRRNRASYGTFRSSRVAPEPAPDGNVLIIPGQD